jgi:glycosyltransferase involved in cell wall biosynthesis
MNRRRRILFVDHTAVLGGGEIALLNLARNLDRTRFDVAVLLCSEGPLVDQLREAGITTHLLPLAPSIIHTRKGSLGLGSLFRLKDLMRMVLYIITLARFIRRNHYDVVHTNSLKADIIGGVAARLAGTQLIWHVRDRIEPDYLPIAIVHVFRFLARVLPSYVVANSKATLKTLHLPRRLRIAAADSPRALEFPARIVHDGTESNIKPQSDRTADTFLRIGLVGRISPWKGQHVFLRAAADIRCQYPNARFQIIGSTLFAEKSYETEVRNLASQLGLEDVVEFTGFRTDVPDLIAKLDILVHASTTGEPFGQVVIEGMAAGKPVVATNGGGVPEIVVEGVTGFLVPMGDPVAMAAAIRTLLADPSRREQMGQAGRQRVLDHFTIARSANRMERIYDELLPATDSARRRQLQTPALAPSNVGN